MALWGFHPGCQVSIARRQITDSRLRASSSQPPKQQKIPRGLPGICCHCSTLRKITPVDRGSFRDWNGVAYSTFVPANRPAAWLSTRDERIAANIAKLLDLLR